MATYVYKLTSDNGGAPCVMGYVLSLALCKPIIRCKADQGSWIFGFAANSLRISHPGNRLIYVARVDKSLPGSEYYADDSEYRRRPDCIYRPVHEGFEWRKGSAFHLNGAQMDHDLGSAHAGFDRARVLISTEFRYFGREGQSLTPSAPTLRNLLNRLTQGHRTNFDSPTRLALEELKHDAFSLAGLPMAPVVRDSGTRCGSSCKRGLASNNGECM